MLKVSVIICLALVGLAFGGRMGISSNRWRYRQREESSSSTDLTTDQGDSEDSEDNTSRHHDMEIIESDRVTNWGEWSDFDHCEGSYAISYRQKVEADQGSDDDTALNEIELTCANENVVRGSSGLTGDWSEQLSCENGGGFKGFLMRSQEPQGSDIDDLAAISLAMICTDDQVLFPSNELWWPGEWQEPKLCSEGMVICGLRVQIEAEQGDGDDTALNNVDFQCCSMEEPTTTTTTTTTPRPKPTTTTRRPATTTTTRRPATTTTTRRPATTTTTRRPARTTTRRPTTTRRSRILMG